MARQIRNMIFAGPSVIAGFGGDYRGPIHREIMERQMFALGEIVKQSNFQLVAGNQRIAETI